MPKNNFIELLLNGKKFYLYNSNISNLKINSDGYVVYNNSFVNELMSEKFYGYNSYKVKDVLNNEKVYTSFMKSYIIDNTFNINDFLINSIKNTLFSLNNETYIFFLKPEPKLSGKKIKLSIPLNYSFFKKHYNLTENVLNIDIYVSPFSEEGKDITYKTYIPEFFYSDLVSLQNEKLNIKNRLLSENLLSLIKDKIIQYINILNDYYGVLKEFKTAKKWLIIDYSSNVITTRDDYNHAFTGNLVKTDFRYFIVYEKIDKTSPYFKYFSKDRVINGEKIDISLNEKLSFFYGDSIKKYNFIEWTQEREDFLKNVEENFKKLKENLDKFLSDMNNEKIDKLIINNKFNNNFLLT